MKPLVDQLGVPSSKQYKNLTWIDSVLRVAPANKSEELNTTIAGNVHNTFFATSTFVSEKQPLTESEARALMKYLYTNGSQTGVDWFAYL